ncbi:MULTISPECIES: gluconate:H+ symporter [Kordiimonas]|uniref:GntT/GntP/DsdX family permease n=1 Tax=Kordiimonas TaxID=288021 RepID=UPI00257EBE59|nr:gluconate:H+ symporter [Kordiimonas sp. UBA4487]
MTDTAIPLMATGGSVALLLMLVLKFRMSAFLALLLSTLIAGLAAGMPPMRVIESVQSGMGGTLGFIAIIVGLGSIFGALLEASGGIEALADRLLKNVAARRVPWLLGCLGTLVAIPVFFDVGLIILAPIVFALAARSGTPPIYLAIPLLAGLATAHAFVPPTPGPMAVAHLLGADIGWVALFGAAAGIPAMLVAGPGWAAILRRTGFQADHPGQAAETSKAAAPAAQPWPRTHAAKALAVIILPLLLILAATLAPLVAGQGPMVEFIQFAGHPFAALLVSCGLAYGLFRPADTEKRVAFRNVCERALEPAGAIILVTGAGGAFKQILVDTGAGASLANGAAHMGLTPLVAGFVLALIVRVAQGSATVAMITAAGLTAPLVDTLSLSPQQTALTVIAIAAGATAASHVNDSGFWLVSRYFSLSPAATLKSWTISASLIGLTGFVVTLILSYTLY